jgi:hypothetical protein
MADELKQEKRYALSNEDIQDILNPDTKIWVYPKFYEMSHIDEAFDGLGRCAFLFLTKSETSGHWLCMFKRNEKTIEYFDSYGERPDAQRKWLTQEQLEALGEPTARLTELLKNSGYRVYYNTHKYQKDGDDINTCGRWIVARLICKDFSNNEFFHAVKQDMKERDLKTPDDWVAEFTAEILGK